MKYVLIRVTIMAFLLSFFMVTSLAAAPRDDKDKFDIENAGLLTGRVVLEDGSPFPYGFVAFFEDVGGSGEHQDYGVSKRSPLMVSFVKEDGSFSTQLFPSGSYFMGAVMQKRWVGGAPNKSKKRYSAIDNDGKYLIFEVKAAETVDIGTVMVREPIDFPQLKNQFVVQGRVLDKKGNGVTGSVVVAKKDINDPKGVFISATTDLMGVYQLKISPGKFYFVARKELTHAGRPKPGGLMGTLGQDQPIGIGGKSEDPPDYIIGKHGQVYKNVDIVMFELPIPDVKRKEIEALVKAKKIDKSTLPEDLPLMKKKVEKTVPSQIKPE